MTWLIAGLLIFLGVHSLRIFDEGLRSRLMHRWGEAPFKTAYSLLSVLGFGLLIYGYGQARLQPIPIYDLPTGLRHASILLVWFSMVLLIAAYVPGNWFKQRLRHPMVLGVKLWAFAHLLSNGNAADLLLFGSFLLWAIASFRAARQRDKAAAEQALDASPDAVAAAMPFSKPADSVPTLTGTRIASPVKASATAITVVLGSLIWAGFLFDWHASLIGVQPMVMTR
ncbi:MAG: protein NrnU [Betaproteobacteria bacterium]|nr:protein NrnU [Betaproteobacteria bacterium]